MIPNRDLSSPNNGRQAVSQPTLSVYISYPGILALVSWHNSSRITPKRRHFERLQPPEPYKPIPQPTLSVYKSRQPEFHRVECLHWLHWLHWLWLRLRLQLAHWLHWLAPAARVPL